MPLPNFFIVGAAKCGTTSLAAYLKQHPEAYFSAHKEPNYFAYPGVTPCYGGPAPKAVIKAMLHDRTITDFEAYQASYADAKGAKAIGDASVRYLFLKQAARNIYEAVPNARIVAVLRDPVARLYSHYRMNCEFQLEPLGLMEAVEAEQERHEQGWGWDWRYVGVGRYAEQIQRYYDLFGREAVKVVLYDDYAAEPQKVFSDICRHLDIDPTFQPDMSTRQKVAYAPRIASVDRWLQWPSKSRAALEAVTPTPVMHRAKRFVRKLNAVPPPKFDPALRAPLFAKFKDDIDDLQALLGRSLPWTV